MAQAAAEAAGKAALLLRAEEVEPDDLLAAQGYLFVCAENLAALPGAMKEMFDRCYYPVLGRIEGRPYATLMACGSDGENALRQLDRIATGWRLRRVADPFIVNMEAQTAEAILAPKTAPPAALDHARELGEAMAEGLAQGVF